VVIRSDLDGELKERLCAILPSTGVDPHLSPTLAWFSLERFAPVTYEHYAPEEQALRKCERALGTRLR
jgi:ABC-type phosphate/phosphonate transport system substrate-binding protein